MARGQRGQRAGKGSTRRGGSISPSIFGKGGGALTNTEVQPEEVGEVVADFVPEFQRGPVYLDSKGGLTTQPFASSGYNFFDKLAGNPDRAALLNEQAAIAAVLAKNANRINLEGDQNRLPFDLEKATKLGNLANLQAIEKERNLIPVAVDKETQLGEIKNQQKLDYERSFTPIENERNVNQFYSSRGIADATPFTGQMADKFQSALNLQRLTDADALSFQQNPAYNQLREAAQAAELMKGIATLRGQFSDTAGIGSMTQINPTGVPTLDQFMATGRLTGGSREQKMQNVEFGGKTFPQLMETVTPGKFEALEGGVPIPSTLRSQVPAVGTPTGLIPAPAPGAPDIRGTPIRTDRGGLVPVDKPDVTRTFDSPLQVNESDFVGLSPGRIARVKQWIQDNPDASRQRIKDIIEFHKREARDKGQ